MIFNDWRPFVYGGIASMTAEFATFPIDLVKARLQVQGQRIGNNTQLKYRGMIHGFITIGKEEGLLALYNGIKPALLRQATYGTLKIGFYQTLKKLFITTSHDEILLYNIIFGMTSGAVANGIANPTDVLKVRLQVNKDMYKNTSMIQAFMKIFRKEGFKGLYRGVFPNMQRAAIITGVELPIYDSAKSYLVHSFSMDQKSFITHLSASLVAGFAAAIAATPIDVIKTRLMNQKHLKNKLDKSIIYKGSIDCLVQTVKHEGLFALYKGIVPSYIRLGPWNTLFFVTYEQLKKLDI